MRQRGAETLVTEEPDAFIAHVRVGGGAGWVTTGSTRKPTAYSFGFAYTFDGGSPRAFLRHEVARFTAEHDSQDVLQPGGGPPVPEPRGRRWPWWGLTHSIKRGAVRGTWAPRRAMVGQATVTEASV